MHLIDQMKAMERLFLLTQPTESRCSWNSLYLRWQANQAHRRPSPCIGHGKSIQMLCFMAFPTNTHCLLHDSSWSLMMNWMENNYYQNFMNRDRRKKANMIMFLSPHKCTTATMIHPFNYHKDKQTNEVQLCLWCLVPGASCLESEWLDVPSTSFLGDH